MTSEKNTVKKPPGPYGNGCLYLRGRIYWISWRETVRRPDGSTNHAQHFESTKSEDKKFAQRVLRTRLQAQGGRRTLAVDPRKVSWEDVRDNFIAHCQTRGSRSLKMRDGKPTLDTVPRLNEFFGGWRAGEIAVADLKRFRAELKADGAGDARANRCVSTLRAALRQAVRDELLTSAELPGYFPMSSEPNVARGAVFVQPEWYAPLRKKLKEPLRSAFTLAYHTGLRVGEMARVRWRDIDTAKQRLALPGESSKSGAPRLVPLPSDFDLKPGKLDDLVFKDFGDPRKSWRAACIAVGAGWFECAECGKQCKGRACPDHGKRGRNGLRYRGLLLRHCRHSFARRASDAGMPEARIMGITGHRTRALFDRYNIGREGDVDRARETMERLHLAEQRGSVNNRKRLAVSVSKWK